MYMDFDSSQKSKSVFILYQAKIYNKRSKFKSLLTVRCLQENNNLLNKFKLSSDYKKINMISTAYESSYQFLTLLFVSKEENNPGNASFYPISVPPLFSRMLQQYIIIKVWQLNPLFLKQGIITKKFSLGEVLYGKISSRCVVLAA